MPAILPRVTDKRRTRTVLADLRKHIRAAQFSFGRLEPDRQVLIFIGGEVVIVRGAVFDAENVWRFLQALLSIPLPVASHVGTMKNHTFKFGSGEPGGAAEGQQA